MHASVSGSRDGWLRAGIAVLAASSTVAGGWALFAPRAFFDYFPGAGHAWVATLPPYNEHLTRDVGALNLAFAVLLAWTMTAADRRLTRAALGAYLVYAVPHFVFHAMHPMGLPPGDLLAQMVTLAIVVLIPLALLALTYVSSRRAP